ncbi:MAG: hypothetical protein ACYSTG_06815 [Planctomycetota bacterium]
MRRIMVGVSILCVVGGLLHGCKEKSDVPKQAGIAEIGERLYDKEETVRSHANYQLREKRNDLVRILMKAITELSKKPDNSYDSPLHLTIKTLGEWRVEDAVPLLAEMVDYQLDRATMPVGKKLPASAYYPAVDALRRIDGVYVRKLVIKRLHTEEDAKVVRLCVWVLFEAYGEDVARLMLQAEEARTEDPALRARLAAAKKLVGEGHRLLSHPELRE